MSAPTPTELRATLVTLVAGGTGTCTADWEELVGQVEVLPLALHPRCNWRVEVGGAGEERKVLDDAIELLRSEHPHVSAGRNPDA